MSTCEKSVIVSNTLGIHARPASLIVTTANTFESSIFLCKDDYEANGKSIISVLGLQAEMDSTVFVRAEGPDCEQAVDAIIKLFNDKFYEE